jgi:NAD-dependent dihydropyrimidine dehydrogenase PreA subunit/DNA-binding Lrp family transcriptional regulator
MPVRAELKPYATKLGFPDSETMGAIFAILFADDESARLAAALPGSVEELAQRIGWPEPRVKAVIEKLQRNGSIQRILSKGDYYRLYPAMIELRDSTVLSANASDELFRLWERLIVKEMPALVMAFQEMKLPPVMRVIPIEETVTPQNSILDIDSARKLFREAELITAIPCPCRTQARRVGRGDACPAPETAVCMQINGFAAATIDRGIGQQLTNAEALKRIGDAEDAGLVHQVRNNVKKDMFMCNCCACCCTGLFLIHKVGYKSAVAPSRFQVSLDKDLCIDCGLCVDRCQFHAIRVNGTIAVDLQSCYGCGNCVKACPAGALSFGEVRPESFVRVT